MANIKTYSPDDVKIVFGAIPITSGLADGTFVNIEPMTDGVSSEAGADGEVARAMSLDPRYQVTLTLQQTSVHNSTLAAAFQADQITGDGVVPIAITDLRGQTILGGRGWITAQATTTYSKEVESREWNIEVVGEYFAGGTA